MEKRCQLGRWCDILQTAERSGWQISIWKLTLAYRRYFKSWDWMRTPKVKCGLEIRWDPRTRPWCGALQRREVVELTRNQPRRLRSSSRRREQTEWVWCLGPPELTTCSRRGQWAIGIHDADGIRSESSAKRSLALAAHSPLAAWTRAAGWAEGGLLNRDEARTGEEEVAT